MTSRRNVPRFLTMLIAAVLGPAVAASAAAPSVPAAALGVPTVPAVGPAGYRGAVLADLPLLYYWLDETGGTTLLDSSPLGNLDFTNCRLVALTGAGQDELSLS